MSKKPNERLDGELNLKALIIFAASLSAVVIAVAGLMWAASSALRGSLAEQDPPQPILPAARVQPLPPQPRLQIRPEEDLRLLREKEEFLLSTFAWVDQASGLARVPIDTAMDLLAENPQAVAEAEP